MELLKLKKLATRCWPLAIFGFVIVIFFWKFLFKGLFPIPADTIVGMYHPWRDVVWDNLTAGVPFKNFLITDSVRQLYPWRQLVVDALKHGQLPLWNPYSFAGTPLLANFQSAPFYFLNSLFFILDTKIAWGILIFLQPLLAGIFLYLYLRQLGLKQIACLIGAISFSFSGFFVAWLEWGTVLHTALWLPLILLSIEKIFDCFNNSENLKLKMKNEKFLFWSVIFVVSLTQSFFAGHLQVFFYVLLFSFVYLIWKLFQVKVGKLKLFLLFTFYFLLFTLITSVQWKPTLEFIRLSARDIDQVNWQQPGWFIPWQNLVQFFAPDFFGNPTTLNYWGEWNYGEFVGYIGVIPLVFVFYAIFFNRKKLFTFYFLLFTFFLSFALPTPWAKLPYKMGIPLISTSQPTRLLVIVDFCLAILAAIGMDKLLENKKRVVFLALPALVYGFLWLFIFLAPKLLPNASWIANLAVSKRNLILPTALFITFVIFVGLKRVSRLAQGVFISVVLVLIIFDLLRFGWKFTPFTKKEWIFPSTKTIEFLKNDNKPFRFMSTDRRIFPPNFSVAYRLQTVDGYDPLCLLRYGELIAASERGKPDISPPFGFNRIITPQNFNSRIINLLNVKYVLSLADLSSPKLGLVFQEGETRVYHNKEFFPRAFMVYNFRFAENKQKAIDLLMDESTNLRKKVILEEILPAELIKLTNEDIANNVAIELYEENKVVVSVETAKKGILVLTDSYYPGWKATIDPSTNSGQVEAKIYRANYNFRAVIVPSGKHKVVFEYGD